MTRGEFADTLEEYRSQILDLICGYPLEIETLEGNLPYRRVVIDKPEDLDRAIARLRAPEDANVSKRAVNRSLFP